ncbi:hypothetical protein NDU88_001369 [Pleurodeles waltl]|uniref:Uncharacterized protein n=1 Tax=Pleurodeles waltl TaxID=8319 RepID=A0AAV7UTZ4_PLEWA|nr:hypothetical protein NDU88_001369 [Pleurodeles waltl]
MRAWSQSKPLLVCRVSHPCQSPPSTQGVVCSEPGLQITQGHGSSATCRPSGSGGSREPPGQKWEPPADVQGGGPRISAAPSAHPAIEGGHLTYPLRRCPWSKAHRSTELSPQAAISIRGQTMPRDLRVFKKC